VGWEGGIAARGELPGHRQSSVLPVVAFSTQRRKVSKVKAAQK
jgi:hypothetical protein